MVILVTGKAGAGKTHWALQWINEQKNLEPRPTVAWLDGDNFRAENNNMDFSAQGRLLNLQAAAEKAAKMEANGIDVICSFVAPTKALRDIMRSYWNESILIYIPGGKLWEGTTYETPSWEELSLKRKE